METTVVPRPTARCTHSPGLIHEPLASTCMACDSRVNLRLCATCGYVGCCESQLGHNATHARASGHAVIHSLPLSASSFTWCYVEGRYIR